MSEKRSGVIRIESDEDLVKLFSRESPSYEKVNDISQLGHEILQQAMKVGISRKNAGTFFMIDRSVVLETINEFYKGKVEIMSTKKALEKGYEEYYWKALEKERADFYAKYGEENLDDGYFIIIHENAIVDVPVQSCLFIKTNNFNQNVHNIVVAKKGSRANLLTGCTANPSVKSALHIGISEFYVEDNAMLSYTMIHNWGEKAIVQPRTGVILGNNATYVSNYIITTPVKTVKTSPVIQTGQNSKVRSTLLVFLEKGFVDAGSDIYLGEGSSAEIISRVIAREGKVISRGFIHGTKKTRGHIECKGMLLSDKGSILSIPAIEAAHPTSELSHEAAIGMLNQEQIAYLMARGLPAEKAVSLITRGFLDTKIMELPPEIEKSVKQYIDMTVHAGM